MRFLENLEIDTWYKAIAYLGGFVLFLAIFVPVHVGTNNQIATIGAGMFFFGLGRWKNHKTKTGVQHLGFFNFVQMTWKERSADKIGFLLEAFGLLLITGGIIGVIGIDLMTVIENSLEGLA
jgi:hypothetical protein